MTLFPDVYVNIFLRLQKIIFTIAVYYILNSLHPKRHRPLSFHTFAAVVKDAVQGIILQIFPVLDLIDKPIPVFRS